jgi:hypothetical protein
MLNQFSRSLRGAAGKGGHLMRKLLALTLSAPLLFAASSAFAADDTSHPGGYAVGVGRTVSVTASPAISLRYMANESLGFELLGTRIAKDGVLTPSSASEFGLIVDYRAASTDKVAYSPFLGLGFATTSTTSEIAEDLYSTNDGKLFSISGGAKLEYFLSRGFSISSRLGYTSTFDLDGSETRSSFSGDLIGTMGVSVWLK